MFLPSRHISRSAALAAVLVVAALGLAGPASAGDMRQAGPVVNLTGDGGKVDAAGASVTVTGTASELRAAGALVTVGASSAGDTSAAGAQVGVTGSVGGDLKAAGAVVDVTGNVAHDANIVGAVLKIGTTTGGNMHVGGASVVISPENDVRGNLQAFGAILTVGGHVGGKVEVGGAVVTFDAQTDGAVEIAGSHIVIGPNARIAGDLTIRSQADAEVQPGAVISGATTRIPPQTWWSVAPWQWTAGIAAAIALGTILAGIVLMLFGGHVFTTATEHVRHRPLSSFLFGILVFVLIPFVALVLMATVIGISIGLALLLVLPFLIVFGHSIAAAGIAAGLLIRRPGAIGVALDLVMLIVGAIVLVAIGLIPWVGPALVAIAMVLGTGAFARTVGGRIRRQEPQPMV